MLTKTTIQNAVHCPLDSPAFLDDEGPSAEIPAHVSTTNIRELYGWEPGESLDEAIARGNTGGFPERAVELVNQLRQADSMATNRETYLALLAEHRLTQAESAALICAYTHRPCSVRTVRSWLNDPAAPSARPCPDWAVDVLRQALLARRSGG